MIVSPLFWEWFNIWLSQCLKDIYHEIKMVALRGTNSSFNSLSHACVNHGNQSQQSSIEVAQSLQTTLNMPQSAVAQHLNANQINLHSLNNVSVQFVHQPNNSSAIKHEPPTSRFAGSTSRLPSHHYRVLPQPTKNSYPRATTPHRPECYHTGGSAGAGYMGSAGSGAPASSQSSLRVQQAPQPSAPSAPQQDMSKANMSGHSFGSQQNQSPQARAQYSNFQYRTSQHATRPNAHPRQQPPFIPGTAAPAAAPVMYHQLMFPSHMGIPPSYQQPRSNAPGYFPYMPYLGYSTPSGHTQPYYYPSNSQQIPAGPNIGPNAPGGRNNPTNMVGQPGTTATPTVPTSTLPHQQPPAHMHPQMPGIRQIVPKRSNRIPIIDPVTQQEIMSELYSNDNQYVSGDSSERQTPLPQEPTHSIAEEFTRMVNEVANQPTLCESASKSNYGVTKTVDLPISSTTNPMQPQINAISTINNNVVKSEILNINESKHTGPDVAAESNETPIVSAISDSPDIVPKLPINIKQFQKNSDQNVQSVVIDTSKNVPPSKHHSNNSKQTKIKPVVPQFEEVDKSQDTIIVATPSVVVNAGSAAPALQAAVPPPPPAPVAAAPPVLTPQPQRIREPRERVKSEDKEKIKEKEVQIESPPITSTPNGPYAAVISSVDSEVINPTTSHSSEAAGGDSIKQVTSQSLSPTPDTETTFESKIDLCNKSEPKVTEPNLLLQPSAADTFAASIAIIGGLDKEATTAIQAQAKLTQSIASCIRSNQTDSKMKDINLNNKTADPDTANGNTEIMETTKEDINQNENILKSSKNNNNKKAGSNMENNEESVKITETFENGKDETDKVINAEPEQDLLSNEEPESKQVLEEKPEVPQGPPVFVPKYKYTEDQWSPLNTTGKKCYDIGLLKQIKEDPMSRHKPNIPILETCNIIRTAPMQEPLPFTPMIRPTNDLFPNFFVKTPGGVGSRNNAPRDPKKDGRNMSTGGRTSSKLMSTPSGSSPQKVIRVSISREGVKLTRTQAPWKPSRYREDNVTEDDFKTQDLYKKFRGILNKLTPQKFDTLLDKVKTLEINNQKRLEGVIDLVFEKAIDEPNFSEAYAAMCNKISTLKVPLDNASSPEQCVNFRGLIINKCQNQFEADKVDEAVVKLEKELAECTDPTRKKELHAMLEEENRRMRMRSVGNVRFIGELYKLKMLTSKIMVYCMNYLIDKLEEEKLECLCKLLTTIGEQVETEVKDQLDGVFKKMQDIVERKSNKISSRVRFMIQDVIELRRRRWVIKSVVDSQPKMMDQIQKEAEQQQRHIELMNANPIGGFRRDDGGRGKRGDGRRGQNQNSFMDNSNNWKTSRTTYTVDTNKLKAASQKNLSNIKLAPQNSAWIHGSGTKNTAQASSNSMISLSKNMYSVLENVQTDPTTLRGSKDNIPQTYNSKRASIERSTFNSRSEFASSGGSRSVSIDVGHQNAVSRSTSAVPPPPAAPAPEAPAPAPAAVPQEPLPEAKKKSVKSMIDLSLINPNDDEVADEIKTLFQPQYHAGVVTEILNLSLEKSSKDLHMIGKTLVHLVSNNVLSVDNFIAGMGEICEFAPDLFIDIPMLYEYLAKILAPLIEKKRVSFAQTLRLSETIISSNQGHIFLKAIVNEIKANMGPSFVKSKWQESGLQLRDWMKEDQVSKWIEDNKFEFLEGGAKVSEETKKNVSPAETQSKLLQLMNSDENSDCIKGWIQDNLGKCSNEDWVMRALIQAICEHALFGPEGRDVPHFNQDRMNKYCTLINDFGESQQAREASCLFGIQQLIHRLEHPQGLTLQIFQYLHEEYIISQKGFIMWEESEKEPEGKGVMMKALTSFFTNIKEADNEDSCSED